MGSCDACGWAGAFMSMLGFGSFGAPIKSEAAKSVDIDPLVFQSYKTLMCFLTCWLVLLFGEPFSFTPWGIASACFWVPSGVAAIAGIKMAGLAVAMGTLSSCIVLVSFSWGIFFFEERIHSRGMACFAIFLMMVGLSGMSYYSSLEQKEEQQQQPQRQQGNSSAQSTSSAESASSNSNGEDAAAALDCHDEATADETDLEEPLSSQSVETTDTITEEGSIQNNNNNNNPLSETTLEDAMRQPLLESSEEQACEHILVCGTPLPRRTVGIACAVFCGLWGGSIMAPEKLAKANTSGVGYLISFSIGAAIVTIALWIFRFTFHYLRLGSVTGAYEALPSFHVRVMWLPGCTAGLLWSVGNFFSLISVKYLGEGVGYSVTQSAMLVSGLWGIFYFKEVTGAEAITKWFMSAAVTISGILLLSYEHHEK